MLIVEVMFFHLFSASEFFFFIVRVITIHDVGWYVVMQDCRQNSDAQHASEEQSDEAKGSGSRRVATVFEVVL